MSFIGSRLCMLLVLLLVGTQLAFAERTTTYFHTDGLGSVVAASDQSGAVLWRKSYAPYGEQIDTQPDNERLSYTGKPHDALLGLTYFGARYYDPQLGRFMSPDPVGFSASKPMSFHRYAYANNNPYAYVDPDGRDPERIFGIMMGIVHSKEDALKIQQAELAANNFVAADGVDTGLALVEAKRALDRGEFVDVPVTAVIAAIGVAVTKKNGSRVKNYHRESAEAEGRPHSVYRTDDAGKVSAYETYNFPEVGKGKRVDVTGPPHNGVPTPHVTETTKHVNPRDPSKFGYREGPVRPANPDEIPRR